MGFNAETGVWTPSSVDEFYGVLSDLRMHPGSIFNVKEINLQAFDISPEDLSALSSTLEVSDTNTLQTIHLGKANLSLIGGSMYFKDFVTMLEKKVTVTTVNIEEIIPSKTQSFLDNAKLLKQIIEHNNEQKRLIEEEMLNKTEANTEEPRTDQAGMGDVADEDLAKLDNQDKDWGILPEAAAKELGLGAELPKPQKDVRLKGVPPSFLEGEYTATDYQKEFPKALEGREHLAHRIASAITQLSKEALNRDIRPGVQPVSNPPPPNIGSFIKEENFTPEGLKALLNHLKTKLPETNKPQTRHKSRLSHFFPLNFLQKGRETKKQSHDISLLENTLRDIEKKPNKLEKTLKEAYEKARDPLVKNFLRGYMRKTEVSLHAQEQPKPRPKN